MIFTIFIVAERIVCYQDVLTIQLTSLSKGLLVKLIVSQCVKMFLSFSETRNVIALLKKPRIDNALSQANHGLSITTCFFMVHFSIVFQVVSPLETFL
jgi:hypothetical protein